MGTNTNGFNYSSDYQGHSGSNILILLFIFLGIFFVGSFKNGSSNKSDIDSDVTDNSSIHDSSSVYDGVNDDNLEDDRINESSDTPRFELYE